MTLDELENDPTPRFVRMVSHEPKDGYNWSEYFQHYEEGDALFRVRILAASVAPDPKAALLTRIRELGVPEVREELIGFCHFRLTVDDVYVDAVRQLAYETVPITYKVDVVGMSEPRIISFAREDLPTIMSHYGNQTACMVDGLSYLVRSVEYETGPTWRGQAWLIAYRPINGAPDTTKPRANHVRDAVEANR